VQTPTGWAVRQRICADRRLQRGRRHDDVLCARGPLLRPEHPRTRLHAGWATSGDTMKKILATLTTSTALVTLVAVVSAAAKWN
jgi:hypothetical protein